MIGDVEVDDVSSIVAQNNEREEDTERRRRNGEEVYGDDVGQVIIQERSPSLRRWISMPNHVLGDGRFGHVVAKQLKLGVNPRRSPQRMLATHAADQLANLNVNRWPANLARW